MLMENQTPIPLHSTHNVIAGKLREQILAGRYAPGVRLVQDELAAEFGVSRTPIREALAFLEREGLVVIAPNVGASVAPFSLENLIDVYTVRAALESHATYLSAANMDEAHIAQLQEKLEAMGTSLAAGDFEGLVDAHNQFHVSIYAAAGRPRLYDLILRYIAQADKYMRLSLTVGRGAADPIHEHKDLVQILKYQDAEAAGNLMRNHLETTMQELEEIIQRQQNPAR